MPKYVSNIEKSQGKYGEFIEPREAFTPKDLTVYLNADGTNLVLLDEAPYYNFLVIDTQINKADFSPDGTYVFELPYDDYDELSLRITPFLYPSQNLTLLDTVDYLKVYINSVNNAPAVSLYESLLISKLAGKFKRFIFEVKDILLDIDFKINIKIGQSINVV